MDYSSLLSRVILAVTRAGELLIAEWQRPDGPRGAGDKADVDVEIEALLRPYLLDLLDGDFWGEETGHLLTGAQFCWVVDPNDGTADFLNGFKGSAISVGLLENAQPVLGVVYAPVLEGRPADCIAWAKGMPSVLRNGEPVDANLSKQEWSSDSRVMVSTAARTKPELNSELCAPGRFVAMPSIAYRLARVAAGDGVAGVSLVQVSAHDVVAGHALLKGAGGMLLNQDGEEISYVAEAQMKTVSHRCFGGSPAICRSLVNREWSRLFE
ncbi:inositol monophosphatase family protein [Pseudomonas sp. GLN_6]|uniref:inositol monophosphatase family protein n=1 Tax=Pseudomonas sp. GLN_6 TaxID=3367183 RepID=UPI00370A5453